jgi:hypothetical protein
VSAVTVLVGIRPEMASVRSSAALMSTFDGVILGIVRYLCLKKTDKHVQMLLVLLK